MASIMELSRECKGGGALLIAIQSGSYRSLVPNTDLEKEEDNELVQHCYIFKKSWPIFI